jgi:hypothetical protein
LKLRDPLPPPCHSRMVLCHHRLRRFSAQRIFIHHSDILCNLCQDQGLVFAGEGGGLINPSNLHSELLGALFDTLALALAHKPFLKLSRRPRLADWGEYAAAVYEISGWGAEAFLEDWDEIVRVQNQATLVGSPVTQAIIAFMEDKVEHTATSFELHQELERVAESLRVVRDRAWPKNARWLWKRIKVVLPLLVAVGIETDRRENKTGSMISLRNSPRMMPLMPLRAKTRKVKPKASGISNESVATINATSPDSTGNSGISGIRSGTS